MPAVPAMLVQRFDSKARAAAVPSKNENKTHDQILLESIMQIQPVQISW